MLNKKAFAEGFATACARRGVPAEVLVKWAAQGNTPQDRLGVHRQEIVDSLATQSLPVVPQSSSLMQLAQTINNIGRYSPPMQSTPLPS